MKIIQNILQLLFPVKCISCQVIVSHDAIFCAKCWTDLEFINFPKCKTCSYPFELNLSDISKICANCLKNPPFFDETISIYRYNDVIGNAIANYKYRDQTHLAKIFAKILVSKAQNFIDDCDIICAIPLHKNKLKIRKFNQSTLIAKHINSHKTVFDLIIRVKEQESQVKLSQKKRIKNLKRAFILNPKYRGKINEKNILLIDDVITTSTTINSVSRVLKKNGAKKVKVLTIAKTIFS